ncbi:MAG: MFS transporter [Proteobacteria bacterium]|nr:MFS transporter [Pseudomonadota bacterium]
MRELFNRDVAAPIFVLIAFQGITTMAMHTFANAPTEIAGGYAIPVSFTGVFTAIVYLSALTFGLFVSGPFGRFGAMRSCQIGLVLGAAGLGVFSLATPWGFVLAGILLGMAHGPMNPAGSHVIMRKGPPKWRPFLFSVKQISVPIGGALAGFLVPTLVLSLGWQTTILIFAAIILFASLLAQPFRANTDDDRNPSFPLTPRDVMEPVRLVFAKGPIRSISIAAFVLIGCQACLASFLVTFLVKEIELPLQLAGLIFGLAHGTSIIARIYLGMLADRFIPTKAILGYSGIITGVCFIVLASFPANGAHWLLCILGVILGNANLGWVGLYFSEVSKLAPSGKAAAATAGSQIFAFGSFVVIPPLFTVFVELVDSYAAGFAIIGVTGILAGFRFLSVKY